jgi:hypothetical protein
MVQVTAKIEALSAKKAATSVPTSVAAAPAAEGEEKSIFILFRFWFVFYFLSSREKASKISPSSFAAFSRRPSHNSKNLCRQIPSIFFPLLGIFFSLLTLFLIHIEL